MHFSTAISIISTKANMTQAKSDTVCDISALFVNILDN